MSAEELMRKGIQVQLDTYAEIVRRVGQRTEKLARDGHPRKVTADEVIADALGLKR